MRDPLLSLHGHCRARDWQSKRASALTPRPIALPEAMGLRDPYLLRAAAHPLVLGLKFPTGGLS